MTKANKQRFSFGPFTLDPDTGLLNEKGERVPIRPQVLSALIYLTENRDRIVTREDLANYLWPNINVVEDQSLNVLIKNLRETLGDTPRGSAYIETIPRKGYRFIGRRQGQQTRAGILVRDIRVAGIFFIFVIAFGLSLSAINTRENVPEDLIAINDLPTVTRANFLKGVTLVNERKLEDARPLLQEVIRSEPNFADAYLWLGRTYSLVPGLRIANAEAALPNYKKALSLNLKTPDLLGELAALTLLMELDATGTIRISEQILETDPENVRAYMLIGWSHMALGDPKAAIPYFNKVNELDPTATSVSGREGWIYYMAGELEEAARVCRILVQAGINADNVRVCLFEAYLDMGELDLALSQAVEIMKIQGLGEDQINEIMVDDPDAALMNFFNWRMDFLKSLDYETSLGQAFLHLRLGNEDEAMRLLQREVEQRHFPYFLAFNSDFRLKSLRHHPKAEAVFLPFK